MSRVVLAIAAVIALIMCAELAVPGSVSRTFARSALRRSLPTDVSVELQDAPPAPTSRLRAARWIANNAATIRAESTRRKVSACAVAGVIAYEALEDVDPVYIYGMTRYAGPGKVHYKETVLDEGIPMSIFVERQGLLPQVSDWQRIKRLASDQGAIRYVAAIMQSYVLRGRSEGLNIRSDLPRLGTLFTEYNLSRRTHLEIQKIHINYAGRWISENRQYLRHALHVAMC